MSQNDFFSFLNIKKNAKLKISPKIFSIRILSDNNSRKYNGTTSYDVDDPMVQRIHLLDMPQLDGQYEVDFTDVELQSSETFCKGISKVIGSKLILLE